MAGLSFVTKAANQLLSVESLRILAAEPGFNFVLKNCEV